MSLKFYKTPSAGRPWRPPVMEEDCRRYRRRAKRTNKWIPPRLAFEEIIRNNTASPCSLNDFMDYLVYVEQDAEPLQFFLWYCGYVHSWTTALTPEQRALAPRWDPDRGRKLSPRERRAKNSSKVSNILEMLDEENDHHSNKAGSGHRRDASSATNFSHPRMTVIEEEEGEEKKKKKEDEVKETTSLQAPAASQPFRVDITAITNHYITPNAPRRLNLTKDDRNAVLAATSTTTHPSALLLAFEKAEALLRGKLHPDFIRYSMANANRAATRLLRLLGLLLLVLGLGLDVALILSSFSRYYRLLSTPLLFAGLAILVAALDGVSLSLHLSRRRHIRPWEVPDLEAGTGAVDLLRKPSLQTLGPENVFSGEEWVAAYERRRLWRRVFERSSVSLNRDLRILQDGVVAGAVLWAALATVGLGVGSIFIPSYNMF
ncbi:regulator of g-protein RGS [Colletotrichum incanum]|nr:regulator of g-protein RGS [Colletotrichum incanum]